ncbi:hypothetical protein GCM10022252_76130 [Streptosporangium oxazolinicum]|uniref:Uncharacterized protein n=1 Tax=Streptosporangium oxazolinicum TaxID=909287 RepID=A0ABP8BLK1_9ACTN
MTTAEQTLRRTPEQAAAGRAALMALLGQPPAAEDLDLVARRDIALAAQLAPRAAAHAE